uniref:PPM-type phosphatase domain-containing protein n=1 Tax=Panagrolaimus sp. JU765 TaxID=591449 RepID=A0AC34R4U8_9BILA
MDQSLPNCIVSVASIQGARETYEDRIDVRARVNGHSPFLFCGIYDGHGGSEAADMAQSSMLYTLEKSENFLSSNHEKFMESIKDGFVTLDKKMRQHCSSWKAKGDYVLPSAGTTASTVIVSNGHAYIAHVGDSPVYLIKLVGKNDYEVVLASVLHTPDHIPDHSMIQSNGGEIYTFDSTLVVKCKYSDNRKGRFLRMTRALGDFWLKHPEMSNKVISAEPDVSCFNIAKEKI